MPIVKKGYYKKIFVGAAALFLLFAPVGIATRNSTNNSVVSSATVTQINNGVQKSSLLSSPYSAFRLTFNLNLAEATSPTPAPVIGAASGAVNLQNPNLLDCAKQPVTCGVYYVTLTVNGAMGLLLAGTAWLVRLGLQFNDNIFNSPAVQTGFSVALAIANLGFVLGIIVIAIATILRNQTYGIKQLLWKLVIMAILVNFGLVITAPIVGFANSMSNYFINATSPQDHTAGYGQYVTTLMGGFAPQTINLSQAAGKTTICNSILTYLPGPYIVCNKLLEQSTASPNSDNYWQWTMALMFAVVLSGLAAFTFLCLAILLIIRYLILAGLLIVLPLAWLTFVFPKFDNSYSKWWNTFIKWTFFPPLALFFIYLAFITAAVSNGGTTSGKTTNTYIGKALNSSDSTQEQGLVTQTGLTGGVFEQAADEILLVGLMVMGLMFANSLTGKAGSMVVNGATGVSKAVGGYVGRKGKQGLARTYMAARGGELNTALQKSRIPFVSAFGRGAANLTESGTKAQVDARHKSLGLGGMDDDRLKAATQGMTGKTDQLAALTEWQKRGKVDKIEKIGGTDLNGWLEKNQGTFKTFAQGKLQADIDISLGSTDTIRRAAKAKAAAGATETVLDDKGIAGPAGARVLASDMEARANEAVKKADDAKAAARATATTPDYLGMMGPAGNTRIASELATRADEVATEARQRVARSGPDVLMSHNGITVKAADLLNDAKLASQEANKEMDNKESAASISHNGKTWKVADLAKDAKAESQRAAEAIDAKGSLALVADKEDILKTGGRPVEAGRLMSAATEKFWQNKDKGDISKMNFGAIFGGTPKFGLDEKTLREIGKSVAHGIVTQTPSSMGTVAGKLDNWKQLNTFTNTYGASITSAEKELQITSTQAKSYRDSMKKVLGAKLAFMGGGPTI